MRLFFAVGAALAIMAVAPSLQARTSFQLNLAGFFNLTPRCHYPRPVHVVPVYVPQTVVIQRPVYEPVYVHDPMCCQPVYTPRCYPVPVRYGTLPPLERRY